MQCNNSRALPISTVLRHVLRSKIAPSSGYFIRKQSFVTHRRARGFEYNSNLARSISSQQWKALCRTVIQTGGPAIFALRSECNHQQVGSESRNYPKKEQSSAAISNPRWVWTRSPIRSGLWQPDSCRFSMNPLRLVTDELDRSKSA
jgi:hypothetical protein